MNLAETLDIAADLMPAAPIVSTTRENWSYADLRQNAAAARAWLVANGVGPGDVVATVQGFTPPFVALLYGAISAGAIVAPLSSRAKAPELAALLGDLRPESIVADERYAGIVDAAVGAARLDGIMQATTGEILARPAGSSLHELSPVQPWPGATAILLHTSGTTGRPKPVPLTHDGVVAGLLRTSPPADGTSRGVTLLAVPNHHVAGLTVLLASVFGGRCAHLLEAFSAPAWLEAVADRSCDHAFVVPTMLRRILDDPGFDDADLSPLRTVAYGAAPMPRQTISEALARFPTTCRFVGSYGQTETGGTVCVLGSEEHEAARAGGADAIERLGSIGRPVEGVEMAILDPSGAVLEAGRAGEIAVRLPADEAWRRTGDLGRRDDDGYVHLISRQDDIIIRGGENIDPAEVEDALGDHPDVADVAVAGVPDLEWGQVVAAFVVPVDGPPPAVELITHAKRRIASFKAPSEIHYVDRLPRTELGKLRRRELVAGLVTTAKEEVV